MPYPHMLHLYQKPAVGSRFIQRMRVYNYNHVIDVIGGFDTANFDIALRSLQEAQQFLEQNIGNRVAIYVDNPVEPAWEGFISRMTFTAGGVKYTISLDQMANRVRVLYTNTDQTVTTQSTVGNDTASQALYGIKQEQVDAGIMLGGTGVSTLRDTILAQRAWPKTSYLTGSGGSGLVRVECLGFYHTLKWEDHRQTTSSTPQIGNLVDTILGTVVNGTTFFDSGDTTDTAANTATVNQYTAKGETVWDQFVKLAELGNATDYYVIGITPTLYSTGTRRLYYRQASTNIAYTARRSDGLRIRNLYGQIVPPWTVRPDAGVRITDDLIGWNGVGDNPTETYIKKIEYDAESQTVVISGDDDLTTEGVFNRKRWNKAQGNVAARQLGAARRLA